MDLPVQSEIDAWGISSGLMAAAVWAFASLLYVKVPISAGAIATWKNILASFCLLLAVVVLSLANGTPFFAATAKDWLNLFISGVLGLALADIAYFRSIQILGAQRGLTLALLTPFMTAILGRLALEESLTVVQWIGIGLTVSGVCILSLIHI